MNRFFFAFFSLALISQAAERPNVVILYADDMGVADVSYGDPKAKIQTPHLDRLASQGMTFTDGHSSSGICTPSRFALLTGQHHWRRFHGIVGAFGGTVFEPEDFTIAKMFKKKATARAASASGTSAGTSMPSANRAPKKEIPGPSLMTGPSASRTVRSIRASTTILETEPLTSPLLLDRGGPLRHHSHKARHQVQTPRGGGSFGRDRWPKVGTLRHPAHHHPKDRRVDFEAEKGATLLRLPRLQFTALSDRPQQALSRKIESRLLRGLRHRDRRHGGQGDERLEKTRLCRKHPGRLLRRQWTRDPCFRKTGGIQAMELGQVSWRQARCLRGGHRVPFIVKWPGKIKPGSVSDEVVSQVDLAASFAKIIGHRLEKNEAIDSYDLLPVLKGEKYDKPLRLATVQNTSPKKFALRQRDWVYINAPTGSAKRESSAYLGAFRPQGIRERS